MADRRVQQVPPGFGAQIGDKATEPVGTNLNGSPVRLQKCRSAYGQAHRPNPRMAIEYEQPCLTGRIEHPVRFRSQINALQDKIRAGDQQRSGIGQTPGLGLSVCRPGVGVPPRRCRREAPAGGQNRKAGRSRHFAAGFPRSQALGRSHGLFRREQRQRRPIEQSASKPCRRSTHPRSRSEAVGWSASI